MKRWFLIVIFLLSIIFSTVISYTLEHHANKGFDSLFSALWWTMVTFTTVGYGDIAPITVQGRLFGMIILAVGVLINSIVVSLVTSWLFAFQSSKVRGIKPIEVKSHILICSNQPAFISAILQENQNFLHNQQVVILSPLKEHPLMRTPYENTPWVSGEAHQVKNLKKASAHQAQIAYVSFEDDSETVMSVMQLENVTQGKAITMALYSGGDYRQHLENVGCDFALSPFDLYVPLMVQAYRSQGAPSWVRSLILRHPDTPTLENHKIPEDFINRQWIDYVSMINQQAGWLPVALIGADHLVSINPPAGRVLKPEDRALVIIPAKSRGRADELEDAIAFQGSAEINLQGHLLICSDNPAFIYRLLEELHLANIPEKIVVLSETEPSLDLPPSWKFEWVHASSFAGNGFVMARATEAKVAFLGHKQDSHTLMAVLRLESLTGGSIFTIASFREPEFDQRLMGVGCDFCINADELTAPILSQTATHPGVGIFVEQIISQDSATESLFLRKLWPQWESSSWLDVILRFKKEYDYMPVGLLKEHGTRLIVNPSPHLRVNAGDAFLFLHHTGAQIECPYFVSSLQETLGVQPAPEATDEFSPLPISLSHESNLSSSSGEAVNNQVTYYLKAAEQGKVSAQFNLGMLYEHGKEVDQNWETAARWYHQAATQGHAKSQYKLGMMYFQGKGVMQDKDKARSWLQQSASQGHERAQKALHSLQVFREVPATARIGAGKLEHIILQHLIPEQQSWFIRVVVQMILIDDKIDFYEKEYLQAAIALVPDQALKLELEEAILFGKKLTIGPCSGIGPLVQDLIMEELIDIATVDRNFSQEEQDFCLKVAKLLHYDARQAKQQIERGIQSVRQYRKRD